MIKYYLSIVILFLVLSCGFFKEKVEKKIEEKVNESIEENLKQIDSTFSREKLDSLKRQLDSLVEKSDKDKAKEKDKKKELKNENPRVPG